MKRWICSLCLLSACSTTPKTTLAAAAKPTVVSGLVAAVPFTVHDNRILVDVYLNGQGPFVMIFDTGSESILTPEVQKLLDLKSQGVDLEDRLKAQSVHLKNVQIGGLDLKERKFAVVKLANIRRAFRFPHLDGIIGQQIAQEMKVRINFDQHQVQFYTPNAPAMEDARALKFVNLDGKPLISGEINNQPAQILIDTGDRSNLTLFHKFAAATKIEEQFAHRERVMTGMGLNGPIIGKIASVQKVSLGNCEVDDVLARLPLTKKGYFYSDKI
jgi:predicted aspartyl protease